MLVPLLIAPNDMQILDYRLAIVFAALEKFVLVFARSPWLAITFEVDSAGSNLQMKQFSLPPVQMIPKRCSFLFMWGTLSLDRA